MAPALIDRLRPCLRAVEENSAPGGSGSGAVFSATGFDLSNGNRRDCTDAGLGGDPWPPTKVLVQWYADFRQSLRYSFF